MLLAALQNVTMRYAPQVVLRDVSMQISSGQRLGLIGIYMDSFYYLQGL